MFKKIALISMAVLCVILLTIYNAKAVNTKQLKIREETVCSDKIDGDLDGFLIAFFSDICYGSFIDEKDLNRVLETVNAYRPDLVIFGGDLIDTDEDDITPEMIEQLKEFLSSIDSRYGKYAVKGDHDRNNESILREIYDDSGFILLSNENRMIGPDADHIILTGIDPFAQEKPQYADLLNDEIHYSISVSHYPDLFPQLNSCSVDLCLAGHSLGGQIYFPLVNLLHRDYGCQQYYHGKTVKDGKILDITNGIGRRNSDARLWADAEIVFYTLKPSGQLNK